MRFSTKNTLELAGEMQMMIEKGFRVVTMAMHVGGEPTHNYPLPVEAIVVFDEEPFSKLQKVFKNFESEKL